MHDTMKSNVQITIIGACPALWAYIPLCNSQIPFCQRTIIDENKNKVQQTYKGYKDIRVASYLP